MPASAIPRIVFPLVVVACCAAGASAQDWGAKMFDTREIKFGSVPRLSNTTFKVKIRNIYVETIQLTSLTTSCGCISWIDKAPISIPSKQERELTIRLDTVGHSGDKRVRAYVSLYEPGKGYSSQVTIPVEGRIRSDFEVRPSFVGFGAIDPGKSYVQRIGVNYIGGRPDWKILGARVSSPHLTAQVVETRRAGGSVTYEATVQIDANAPLGILRDQLILTTNDVGDSAISIPVEAKVEPDIVVTDLQFGMVRPGQPKSMTVVVRGRKPFKIEKVKQVTRELRARPAEDGTVPSAGTVALSDSVAIKVPAGSAAVQIVTLTVTPPAEAGMFDEEFSVVIEGRPQPVTFKARGRIQPQEVTTSPN